VFPGRDEEPWSRTQANNWRARVWRPVLESLATEKRLEHLATAIPYDCRGSFVSLHLRAGASPLEVARWAGHSPQVMFSHYANVIEELVGEPLIPVEDQIARARDVVEDTPAEELDNLAAELAPRNSSTSPRVRRSRPRLMPMSRPRLMPMRSNELSPSFHPTQPGLVPVRSLSRAEQGPADRHSEESVSQLNPASVVRPSLAG